MDKECILVDSKFATILLDSSSGVERNRDGPGDQEKPFVSKMGLINQDGL